MASSARDHPDLPILDELGDQLQRAARGAEPDAARVERPRAQRRRSPRWLWPALAAAVLFVSFLPLFPALLLTGDGRDAGAGREGASSTQRADVLASGEGPEESWRVVGLGAGCIGLQAEGAQLATTDCAVAGQAADAAAALASGALSQVTVARGERDGFVFGRVAEGAERVRVTVGDRPPVIVAVERAPSGSETIGVFAAALDDPVGGKEPVRVRALDARGRTLDAVRAAQRG